MPAPVTKDPQHPDFPHDTAAGYRRGCRCQGCRDGHARTRKHQQVRRDRGTNPPRRSTPQLWARVDAHVKHLIECAPGATPTHIEKAAGLGKTTLTKARQRGVCSPATARAVLAVKPDQIASMGMVPVAEVNHLLRTMEALGYPLAWVERQVQSGTKLRDIPTHPTQKFVTRDIAEEVKALSERIGGRLATEADGIPTKQARHARACARRAGFYPPACYDEDGTLDWRALRDHPWSQTDEVCHGAIHTVRLIVANPNATAREVAHMDGKATTTDESAMREIQRIKARLKITQAHPDYVANRARLADALDAFDSGQSTPVEFVLDHGIYEPAASIIARDHPDRMAWVEADTQRRLAEYKARPISHGLAA